MKKKILIGFLNKDIKGAIPTITKAFIDGLCDKYEFVPFYMNRSHKNIQTKFNFINIYYFIKHYLSWIKTLLINKPDIVHFPITSYWNLEKSLLFLSTAKLFGVKITIGHIHGGAFDIFWSNLGNIRQKIAVKQFKKLNGLIVLSEYWKFFFGDKMNFKNVDIVNNPISLDFENAFNNFEFNYMNNEFLFVGTIGKRKGVYDIIEAVKKLKNEVKINIVGPEDQKGDIQAVKNLIKTNNLKNSINVVGCKYNEGKILIYKNMGVFLFPSHFENFPLVIIEAACAALPIITTPIGALPEFFTHMKNIYFVEPGNIKEINMAITYLINNPNERERLGKAARKVFEKKLSRKKIMKQLDNVYENLIND